MGGGDCFVGRRDDGNGGGSGQQWRRAAQKDQEIPRKIGGDLTPYFSWYLLVFLGIFQILLQR